ncbi:hypothetical protein ScPMuIL_007657 [Solemya velum]
MTDPSKNISPNDLSVLNRIFNPSMPHGDVVEEDTSCSSNEELSNEVREAKKLELEGVKAAEAGDIIQSVKMFNEAVKKAPAFPSCYNNRAQALRLRGDNKGALVDLDQAIALSGGVGTAACQAYVQRALIRRLEGKEESALEDFKRAAQLGSQFAKEQVIALNPYAALCNQMLAEVMYKMRTGQE